VFLDHIVSEVAMVVALPDMFYRSWWFQGLIFTGIWVIGHEVIQCHLFMTPINHFQSQCGHGAFSDRQMINDTVGFVRYVYCHKFIDLIYT